MKTKNSHKVPYAFSREARRLFLFDSFHKEQIISIIPQMAFDNLLSMSDTEIGQIVRGQILFLMSDGEKAPDYTTDNSAHQDCYETIMEITKRYMSYFRTRKKKRAIRDKKQITGKYLDDGSDMQELSELSKLRNNTLSFDPSSVIKPAEEMPIIEDVDL